MLIKLPYYIAAFLFSSGIYMMLVPRSYLTKLLGLGVMQSGILFFYISLGKIFGGIPPIIVLNQENLYSNPLPHVLMLTAIVVGFATMAVGIGLIIKIDKNFNTIEENEFGD